MTSGSRLRNGLLAVLTAVFVASGGQTPAQAAATSPDLGDFRLRHASNQDDLQSRVYELDGELPTVGVQELLDTANRTAVQSSDSGTCNPGATNSLPLHGTSYCFAGSDGGTVGEPPEWMPQGITTVADAQSDQRWGSKRAVLVSWYDKAPGDGGQSGGDADETKGCRVTFLDPDTLKYRHVLLVYPYQNSYQNPTYMSLRTSQTSEGESLHCGGMAWYGNYLYVADTARGFRVFDMRHIYDLGAATNGDTSDKYRIGRHDGVYYAHGYRYVMPEVNAWTTTVKRTGCLDGGGPNFSYVGLDRSGLDHLTTGEYCASTFADPDGDGVKDPDRMGRVARWPLDGAYGTPLLASDGYWYADAAYRLPQSNIQGAVSYNGRWYLNRSRGDQNNGVLYVTKPVTSSTGVLEIESAHRAAVGVEDLSHWPGTDRSAGDLWTVTEHEGKRMIYACPISELDSATRGGEICGLWPSPPA
ncbi:hypothetical protein JS756_08095 [Streptomyces actuosus]|uniref:Secreted protein n=1 Tax=Streptomyces actuosus TaxID=1885 RepID=A0ABS2VLU6_STRAS|nr:hypothetical protein [Streptomyces actuosus]MBN0044073.1 hypothetical protein [Streptomyces actuosus]